MGQVARKRDADIMVEIFGRHVNRAARIEAHAEPGSVLTSFVVYDTAVGWLRHIVNWTHLPPVMLKGFNEPISLHQAWLLPDRSVRYCVGPERLSVGKPQYKYGERRRIIHASMATQEIGEDPYSSALESMRKLSNRRGLKRFFRPWVVFLSGERNEADRALVSDLSSARLGVTRPLSEEQALSKLKNPDLRAVIIANKESASIGFIKEVRARGRDVPILILTSLQWEVEHGEEALASGANVCTSGWISLFNALAKVLEGGGV
jgi:hypothetical protein